MHLLVLSNGYLLVAYNHSPVKRTPLSLAVSRNQGRSWHLVGEIETDSELQFAYPTMDQRGSNLVVVYSVMRSDDVYRLICLGMKTAVLDLNLLR